MLVCVPTFLYKAKVGDLIVPDRLRRALLAPTLSSTLGSARDHGQGLGGDQQAGNPLALPPNPFIAAEADLSTLLESGVGYLIHSGLLGLLLSR